MQQGRYSRYAPVVMDASNFRSTRISVTGSWWNISLAAQVFLRGRAIRFVFGGLLAGALVTPAIAQSTNAASENPQQVFLSLLGTPSMGDPKARVAIVEFGDYQCPYCGEHANHTLPQIVTDYVKTGKVRYFFKDFPIEAIHSQAFKAAEAARCAGEQGKYWDMHDRLFKDQLIVIAHVAPAYALALGLDVPKFQQCLDNDTYAPQIRKDLQEGRKLNVPGTPEFYLGTLDAQGSGMKVVSKLSGAFLYGAFQQLLDQMLSASEGQKKNQ